MSGKNLLHRNLQTRSWQHAEFHFAFALSDHELSGQYNWRSKSDFIILTINWTALWASDPYNAK